MNRHVTAAELVHGWNCETCHRDFTEGDVVIGVPVGFTSDGTLIEGDYVCFPCFVRGGDQ